MVKMTAMQATAREERIFAQYDGRMKVVCGSRSDGEKTVVEVEGECGTVRQPPNLSKNT
jgi:hypothetical protein